MGSTFACAVIDTGCPRSVIDESTAALLGFKIKRGDSMQYGTYVACGGKVQSYIGVVKGPVVVYFSTSVYFLAGQIHVFKHSHPLILIGADILKLGTTRLAATGFPTCLLSGIWGEYDSHGKLTAMMIFDVNSERHGVPMLCCSRQGEQNFCVAGTY